MFWKVGSQFLCSALRRFGSQFLCSALRRFAHVCSYCLAKAVSGVFTTLPLSWRHEGDGWRRGNSPLHPGLLVKSLFGEKISRVKTKKRQEKHLESSKQTVNIIQVKTVCFGSSTCLSAPSRMLTPSNSLGQLTLLFQGGRLLSTPNQWPRQLVREARLYFEPCCHTKNSKCSALFNLNCFES